MRARRNGLIVLAIQVVLVLSIGVKYAWERHHCPMVWTKANQFDPFQPIRGRYLAMTLQANACDLPLSDETKLGFTSADTRRWQVVPAVRNGELTGKVVAETYPGPTQQLIWVNSVSCNEAVLSGTSKFFIPEHAKSPFQRSASEQLWALVTVPPSGPPRPVKLAVSDATGWHVLDLD